MPFHLALYDSCRYCQCVSGELECAFLAETDLAAALVNQRQYERGASLVIPKVHRETILDVSDAEIASMYRLARRLARAVEAAFGASNVRVTAFPTKHAMESFGYRFDTPDRSIVISGDTNPTQATIDACHGLRHLDSRGAVVGRFSEAPSCLPALRFPLPHHDRTTCRTRLPGKASVAHPLSPRDCDSAGYESQCLIAGGIAPGDFHALFGACSRGA